MMANDRIPSDPYRSPNDTYRPTGTGNELRSEGLRSDELRSPAQLDNELQPDLELAEGPASNGRIAMFAVAIAVVLGAVFYGLNNSSVEQSGTSSIAQTSAPAANPAPTTTAQSSTQPPAPPTTTAQNSAQPAAAPAGMRDVTPKANTQPGMTTGAAPSAKPQTPPASAPTGQEMNQSGNPPTNPTANSTTK